MSAIALFDPPHRDDLLPLVFTRSVSDLRFGIHTLAEKWQRMTGGNPGVLTQEYLQEKYEKPSGNTLFVNGAVSPSQKLWQTLESLGPDEVLVSGKTVLGLNGQATSLTELHALIKEKKQVDFEDKCSVVFYPWDLFLYASFEIKKDLQLFRFNRLKNKLDVSNTVFGNEVFVEEGAKVRSVTLNSEAGPIYIGKNTEVMEGTVIRGPFALLDHSVVKLSAKIYGATVIGPYSKVGGEVTNSVIQGYSNKGHDGFLGNSVLGEWCNLGADTNTSNLKNNYSDVRVYNYPKNGAIDTGEQFCGLIMGDHAKTGINTMLNTGTVVGVSANVFGGGFPPKFIPSFYWGGRSPQVFKLEKAFEVAERMMSRRNVRFTDHDRQILTHIYGQERQKVDKMVLA